MSICNSADEILSSCTTSSLSSDASIIAGRSGNNFQFYGLIGGPGIQITENTNTIRIDEVTTATPFGKFVNMGQDLTHAGPISYNVITNSSGPGQYDLLGDFIPITGPIRVSYNVTYTGPLVAIEFSINGQVVAKSATGYSLGIQQNTFGSSRVMMLNAGDQISLRIAAYGSGTLFLSKSYLTISTA